MEFAATIWLHLDAIPYVGLGIITGHARLYTKHQRAENASFIVAPATAMFKKLPPVSTQSGATSAVQGAIKFLHPVRLN